MATYKKMLKNRRGDNIIPAFGGQIVGDDIADGAITNGKIADDAITTAKIANGQITIDKLMGFFTANTTDTWVPVSSGGNLQHRVIKAFNADGSIPASALASDSVENAKIKNGAVTNAKIASNTIETGKIKWSTLKYNFTATTDGNGFMVVPTSVVRPATGFIIAVRKIGAQMFTNIFSDTQGGGRFTIQCETWDHQKIGNTSVNLDILYVLVS
jgi:hypothetical protein